MRRWQMSGKNEVLSILNRYSILNISVNREVDREVDREVGRAVCRLINRAVDRAVDNRVTYALDVEVGNVRE